MTGTDATGPGRVEVAELAREDVEDVVGLWLRLVEEHRRLDPRYRMGDDAAERYRIFLLEGLFRPDRAVFVARADGRPVGYIAGRLVGPSVVYDERLEGVVQDAYVLPEHRNRGVGSRLVERLVAYFREKDATNVLLDVSALNPGAERFWRHHGFTEFRRTLWLGLDGGSRGTGAGG